MDIDAGEQFVKRLIPMAKTTFSKGVLSGAGGFASLFALKKYRAPVLVAGTDGVGTKLKLATLMNRHETIGVDLVAMCVNDVVVTGAAPLFFLDYFSTGKLHPDIALQVMKGIVKGCRQAGCALVGGETAEMPSFYPEGVYDLAGFAVGAVERTEIITGKRIRPKDLLIGVASSGLHSNGFSLALKVLFEEKRFGIEDRIPGLSKPLGETLLEPTVIYVDAVLKCRKAISLYGVAHVTGGGITRNLPRILPKGSAALVYRDRWTPPAIFQILQRAGDIATDEMYTVFNMGIGMILVVPPADTRRALTLLKRGGYQGMVIGEIMKGKGNVVYA